MRTTVRRHLGKVVAGTAIAVASTAVMVAITLPGTAGADDTTGQGGTAQSAGQAAAAGASAAVPPGVVQAAPDEGEKGKGSDPLTDDEMKRAESVALSRQAFNAAQNVEGERGPQRLGVELAAPDAGELDDPDAPRRADVTFYDYKTDTVVTKTVNLDTGKVENTGTQRGVQPPLSADEQNEAARVLIADPLGAGLKADYKDATGKELTSPDQLELSSMIYHSVPGAQPAALDTCGAHRCVRLLPKVKNGPWIDSRSLVIDLSAGKVTKLNG
ncbi:Tat pathway signal sequence domain protein [Streptomyces sp. DSM 15324]|uniref:Tat pathway signal sequence domain protein n=1 Tax=Streptomyces sp. DSM 15324 TaxID=1739111 RepID=UPI0007496E4F|nr:Tat pathway signal sequence domain protein [Streptomyces sp. DSM 15324]KUO12744.1 Tat pathway signal sequence domain protein [Streptomyces sp. DSM 15324]